MILVYRERLFLFYREQEYPVDELSDHEAYREYLFSPIFVDVSQRSDTELATHGQMSGLDLLFKHVFDKPSRSLLDHLFSHLQPNSGEVQHYALEYILNRFDIDKQILLDEALKYFDRETVMTAAQQLRQEGMQQEKHIIAERMLQKGLAISDVSDVTGLSSAEIAKLKK